MMEGSHSQYLMYVKSHSHIEAPIGDGNKNYYSWEEKAFAEETARIPGGSMWPPQSYSCTFCKREFRSAQALGGHMNIHRRDRARLKQYHNYETLHRHKSYFVKSFLGNHHSSAPDISNEIDCGLNAYYPNPATTITTTRLSCISTPENCGQHSFSPSSSSSIVMGHMRSSTSKQEGVVKAREYNFNGLGCSNYVETSLSVGLTPMFGQKSSSTVPCEDRANISCKRLKTSISSLSQRPCSNDKNLALQPKDIPLGVNHGKEDLDLELRLGKQQKV